MSGIEIVQVADKAALDRFIGVPARLFAGDPHFVPPLVLERRDALSPKKNPFFEHAEAAFFIARRDGRDVGRISAQSDTLVPPEDGHFGMLAAEDDADAYAALFGAAEAWLRSRGKRRVLGPFSLSINEETGLLVKGFDAPPMLFMGHDPRHAGPRVEAQGYAKAKDVIAYLYDIEHELPLAARRLIEKRMPAGMRVRPLDTKRYEAEFAAVTAIFNDAWSGNWGFVPFTPAEIAHMGKALKPILDPSWVAIVELDGEAIGFGLTLPNLNELIADFEGRLLPFNWARLLWRIKRGARTARVPLMGIRRRYNGGLTGALAAFLVIDAMRRAVKPKGVRRVELSWILEDNLPMRNIIESLGAEPYKTYRVYEKRLA